jgi:hypothetical protein
MCLHISEGDNRNFYVCLGYKFYAFILNLKFDAKVLKDYKELNKKSKFEQVSRLYNT